MYIGDYCDRMLCYLHNKLVNNQLLLIKINNHNKKSQFNFDTKEIV